MTNPASLCPSLTQSHTCQHPHFVHLPPETSPNQHHSLHSGGLRPKHALLIEGSRNCIQDLHKRVRLLLKGRDSLMLTVPRSPFEPSLLTSRSRFLLEKLSSSANPEIFHTLWRPNGHYRIQRSPLLFPVSNQMNTVYALPSYYLRYALILSSIGLPKWSPSCKFPNQIPLCTRNFYPPTQSVRFANLILLDLTIIFGKELK